MVSGFFATAGGLAVLTWRPADGNGGPATTVDLYSPTLQGRRIVFAASNLSSEALTLHTIQITTLATANPASSNDAEFFPGMVKKWGLGFMISTEAVPGGRSAGSLNWAGLGNTYFWIDPARGVAGVILMQLLPFADPQALALLDDFERAVYAGLA